ncbi:cell envelope integrity protein TolA [Methylobacterium brachiatum]
MEFHFDRKEPGVWISAGTHVALLAFALFSVAAPALPEAQEGVPVEVITENQFSEITKGERQADKPMPNAQPRADRQAEKVEDREPENAKTDAPTAPTRTAEMKLANAEEMPLRAEPDPQEVAKAAKAAQEKREAEKAAAKAAEKAAEKAAADKAAAAEKAAAAKAEAKAAAKAEAEKREQLDKLIERQEAEAAAAAAKAAAAKAEAKAKADAAKAEAAREAARKAAEAKAEAEAERQKEMAEAKAAQEKAEAAAKAKAKAMADAKAKADGEAKARKQAELANKFNAGDIRSMLASKVPSQSTGATGHTVQKVAALGAATGTAQRLSPSLRDALVGLLQQQIERCYSAPPGAAQGVVLPVLDIRLNPNGSLSTEPRIMRGGSSAVDQSIAQAALRAVRRCAPYNIPATYAPYYNDWKAINAEFEFTAT